MPPIVPTPRDASRPPGDPLRAHAELENALNGVLRKARWLLRQLNVRKHLEKSFSDLDRKAAWEHRVRFWQAFIQAVLAPTFGENTPGDDWQTLRDELTSSLQGMRDYRGAELTDPPRYIIAQFWNADDERSAAFVVPNRFEPDAAEWQNRWALMAEVLELASKEAVSGRQSRSPFPAGNASGAAGGPTTTQQTLSYSNLGNFVVRYSKQIGEACAALGFSVGVPESTAMSADDDFQSAHLRVPLNVADPLLQLFAEAVDGAGADARAARVLDIRKDAFWDSPAAKTYLQQADEFFHGAYPGHELKDEHLKVMLVNNLGIVRDLVDAENGNYCYCQYIIPTFHLSTSYLGLLTERKLDLDELKCYSRFAQQLFGLMWAHDSVRKLEQDKAAILERARTAARAAIMSRNLSHNIGSHVLANPRLYRTLGLDGSDEDTVGRKRALETFHQYVQARLDFLARAISQQSDRCEPVFFVGEMLNGFFRQTVVLETLLSDRGYPLAQITQTTRRLRFHVRFDPALTGGGHTYVYGINDAKPFPSFARTKDRDGAQANLAQEDVLVGVPGGAIGCQALYALLENVMRNAAKYGNQRDTDSDLKIHIQLRHAAAADAARHEQFFVLELWDNLSHVSAETTAQVRGYIESEIILQDGNINPEGHGIQEMKIAAGILSGNAGFLSDNAPEVDGNGYATFLREEQPTRISTERPLRCYSAVREGRRALIYQVLIPRARLVGIVAPGDKAADKSQSVWYYASVEELAEQGGAFGVLLDVGQEPGPVVAAVALHHEALPYRLVVVTDAQAARWRDAIDRSAIPPRRLRVIADGDLYRMLQSGPPEHPRGWPGADGWQGVILRLYGHWLNAYKPLGPAQAWNVFVGFERSHAGVEARWGKQLKAFAVGQETSAAPVRVELSVASRERPELPRIVVAAAVKPLNPSLHETRIVFDNHGRVFPELANNWSDPQARVYHKFSGREMSLYQSLESPPEDAFSFAWFVYQLVEGCLTDVVIVDERFAEATIDDLPDGWINQIEPYHAVGIHPGYSVSVNGKLVAVSEHVSRVLAQFGGIWKQEGLGGQTHGGNGRPAEPPAGAAYTATPGVHFREGRDPTVLCVQPEHTQDGTLFTAKPLLADVIIIHEGVADDLANRVKRGECGNWNGPFENQLFSCVPRIIRTSGRGVVPRHLSNDHPFIEFSELSEVTYRGMNKPNLGRAVLSATGQFREPRGASDGEVGHPTQGK